jgi:uncharacterized Zn finger protein
MPFKDYPLKCPKCGSERIQGEGSRHELYLYTCLDCGKVSPSRTVFKKKEIPVQFQRREDNK